MRFAGIPASRIPILIHNMSLTCKIKLDHLDNNLHSGTQGIPLASKIQSCLQYLIKRIKRREEEEKNPLEDAKVIERRRKLMKL